MVSRIVTFLIYLILFFTFWGKNPALAAVDPARVDQIIGQNDPSDLPGQAGTAQDQGALDYFSAVETNHLGGGNKDWTISNPKWKSVYDRVRADLGAANDLAPVMAAERAAVAQADKDLRQDVAAQLSEADADAILAYYRTPEGQRYQAFEARIDRIMGSGMTSAEDLGEDAGDASAGPSHDDMKRYERIIQLSRSFQSMTGKINAEKVSAGKAADQNGTGNDLLAIMALNAAIRNRTELEAIGAAYRGDLPSFEAFNSSEAAQHLFHALGDAVFRATSSRAATPDPVAVWLEASFKKHEAEWTALYTGASTN